MVCPFVSFSASTIIMIDVTQYYHQHVWCIYQKMYAQSASPIRVVCIGVCCVWEREWEKEKQRGKMGEGGLLSGHFFGIDFFAGGIFLPFCFSTPAAVVSPVRPLHSALPFCFGTPCQQLMVSPVEPAPFSFSASAHQQLMVSPVQPLSSAVSLGLKLSHPSLLCSLLSPSHGKVSLFL